MVIPLGAREVVHLVHHGFWPVVHCEIRLEGAVDRRKLKFATLNTSYKLGLALEWISSPRERGKQINKEIKQMTRWFVLPRFGSCEPSPRWGGHKDRVSFNHFPLSNGHPDRVSFLLNQTGHLDPTRTTTQLVSLTWITSHLKSKNEEEESDPRTRAQRTRTKLYL
jgi:hypothetical protein